MNNTSFCCDCYLWLLQSCSRTQKTFTHPDHQHHQHQQVGLKLTFIKGNSMQLTTSTLQPWLSWFPNKSKHNRLLSPMIPMTVLKNLTFPRNCIILFESICSICSSQNVQKMVHKVTKLDDIGNERHTSNEHWLFI